MPKLQYSFHCLKCSGWKALCARLRRPGLGTTFRRRGAIDADVLAGICRLIFGVFGFCVLPYFATVSGGNISPWPVAARAIWTEIHAAAKH